jgi:integrase
MLKRTKHDKRATSDEPIFVDSQLYLELSKLIDKLAWGYSEKNIALLQQRDKALFALLIVAGPRAAEAIQLKKKQFRIYPNRIEIAQVETEKHGLIRKRIIMPLEGNLAPITQVFQKWFEKLPDDPEAYIFPRAGADSINYSKHISRVRVYQIVSQSGMFPHWARAVCANIWATVFGKDAWKLKNYMGWKRLESSSPYIQSNWEEDEYKIFKV